MEKTIKLTLQERISGAAWKWIHNKYLCSRSYWKLYLMYIQNTLNWNLNFNCTNDKFYYVFLYTRQSAWLLIMMSLVRAQLGEPKEAHSFSMSLNYLFTKFISGRSDNWFIGKEKIWSSKIWQTNNLMFLWTQLSK